MQINKNSENFYTGAGLDRADYRRSDAAWLAARLADPDTRLLPVWQAQSLVSGLDTPATAWLSVAQATEQLGRLDAFAEALIFLGLRDDTTYMAIDLSTLPQSDAEQLVTGYGLFQDLRNVGPLMEREEGAVLAYARGLVHWHQRHQYCGACGSKTISTQGGHVRSCSNRDCAIQHFPRSDPAVIMLVHDGDRCVLGRHKSWPQGRYSTLAGFVEPGESLEEAVAREVYEEVGLSVTDVTYESSQPWPFPSSIMLGFRARSNHGPLRINEQELEMAGWYSREDLRASPENEVFCLPRKDSIARRLIEDWLAVQPNTD